MSRNILQGLVGAWCPSLGPSGYTLLDRSGRGNHGTLTNMDAGSVWTPGTALGTSTTVMRHDGTNDYVTGSPRAIIGLGDMTWAAWVLVRSGYGVVAHSNWTSGMLWYAGNAGAGVVNQGIYFASSATSAVGATSLSYNTWNHVGWCRRGTSLDIYLNGRLDTTRTSNTGPTFANTLDWGGYAASSEWLPGSIGDRGVWGRALSAAEFAALYQTGMAGLGRLLTQQPQRRVFRTAQGNRRRRLICGAEC